VFGKSKKMSRVEVISFGYYYHIYNCGINGCDLFKSENDYLRFLEAYKKYMQPVSDTLAWCLMRNHFHVLIKIKEEKEIVSFHRLIHNQGVKPLVGIPSGNEKNFRDDKEWKSRKPTPSKQLSHLFNGYAQYFNKKYDRHGSLFEKPFRRKLIDNDTYLRQVMLYINTNPIHHKVSENIQMYPWTSYLECISEEANIVSKHHLSELFGDVDHIKSLHKEKVDLIKMKEYLEL